MNARVRNEAGQAIVFMVFALVTIVGMAAIVVDGGRWFQAQRHLQTVLAQTHAHAQLGTLGVAGLVRLHSTGGRFGDRELEVGDLVRAERSQTADGRQREPYEHEVLGLGRNAKRDFTAVNRYLHPGAAGKARTSRRFLR
jgi:hypothetical protein